MEMTKADAIGKLVRGVFSDLNYAMKLCEGHNIILAEDTKTNALQIAAMALRLSINTTAFPKYFMELIDKDFEKIKKVVDEEEHQKQFVEDDMEFDAFIPSHAYPWP